MIKGYFSKEKRTPKQFAHGIMLIDLEIVTGYWSERYVDEYRKMTDKERAEVNRQLEILTDRIDRLLVVKSTYQF